MPMTIVFDGLRDIMNFLYVFFFLIFGLGYIGYIMFSIESEHFSSIHASIGSIANILMNNFDTDLLYDVSPYESTIFMLAVSVMLKQLMFWLLLGIIYENFIREYKIYLKCNKPHFIWFYLKATLSEPFKTWNENRKDKEKAKRKKRV